MNFAEPRLIWMALAAPLAAATALWLWRRRAAAEAAWASRAIEPRLRSGSRPRPALWAAILLGLATLGIVLALARPRWGESIEKVDQRGVDIVFVIDSSASMGTYDVLPSRIWLAQSLVRRMAQELPGNRVALVQAEGVGVVMAPLTVDVAVLDLLLDAIEPGSLPLPGTQFAPALGRAIDLFPAGHDKQRVMVLLSDGEDHDEELEPVIQRLVEAGIVVHTVGVGTAQGAPVPVAGHEGEFKRTAAGGIVISRLQPGVLEKLSTATGGLYLEASNANVDPGAILDRISGMQKRGLASSTVSTLEERFQWPLAAAAAALGLWLAVSPYSRRPGRTASRSGSRRDSRTTAEGAL
ncbi:MAG: VWA domain-containing protein [Thermoanaerobaculia bacterium]